MGVAGHAVAHHLGQDLGTASLGVLQALEHNHPGAFADHEAVALGVEGATGRGGVVVAEGQGLGAGKSRYPQRSNGRFGTTSDHHVSQAQLDQPVGITDGIGAGGAGGGYRAAGSLGAKGNGR